MIRTTFPIAFACLMALTGNGFGQSGIISTIAGSNQHGDGAPATSAQLLSPTHVAFDSAGNLYIADFAIIRKVTPNGLISTFAGNGVSGFAGDRGQASAARFGGSLTLSIDGGGNFYIADTNNNRIRRITPAGVIDTIAGTGVAGFLGDGGQATAARLNQPRMVIADASGTLYISDSNRIRQVKAGVITTIAGTGVAGFDSDGPNATTRQLGGPFGLALDAAGNLYIADTSNHRIRKLTPAGVISTVAGSGIQGFVFSGFALEARFQYPTGVLIAPNGDLYIADTDNNVVVAVTPAGAIRAIAGDGAAQGFGGDGKPATSAQLNSPGGLIFDAAGNLYIADQFNRRVRKVSTDGVITTIAGSADGRGETAATAQLAFPSGISVSAGYLYIADTSNNIIRKFSGDGVLATVIGSGSSKLSGDGGQAIVAELSEPNAAVRDAAGSLYIADSGNNRIRQVTPGGTVNTIAGTGASAPFINVPSYNGDGLAVTARLNHPLGVAVDGSGNIYLSDTNNQRVRKIARNGQITTIAGTGDSGFTGDNGPAISARVSFPRGIAVDGAGNVYFADWNNNRIRKITPAGVISTVAGAGAYNFTGDGGPATAATLRRPSSIALDAAGNLFIADTDNNRIRLVTTDGTILTIAGNGTRGFSGDGGAATSASLGLPQGVAIDAIGNLYIADTDNNRIRRVVLGASAPSWTASPTSLSFISAGAAITADKTIELTGSAPGLTFTAVADTTWLRLTPAAGAIPASLRVSANPAGLAPGNYSATIRIRVPDTADQTIGVTFVVSAPPQVTAAPASLSFTALTAASQSISVSGAGGVAVPFTVSATSSTAWLSVSPTSGQSPATLSVSANPAGLAPNTYTGSITITGPASTTPVTLPVVLIVPQPAPAPSISLSPSSLVFTTTTQASQDLSLTSTGTDLAFSATASGGAWLSVSPSRGQTPAKATVSVNPSGLEPNFYSGTIQVSGQGFDKQLPVTLRVLPSSAPPTLSADPATLRFQWYSGLLTPAPQRIQIATDGGKSATVQLNSSVTGASRWLSTSASSLAAPGSFNILVNPAGLEIGGYDGEVTVESGGSVLLRIPVQLSVTSPVLPRLAVDADSLQLSAPNGGGDQISQITVKSPSPQLLNFRIQVQTDDGSSWLTANRGVKGLDGVSSAQSTMVVVSANPGSLQPGTYTGSITLTADLGGSQSQLLTIPVVFAVTGRPVELLLSHTGQMLFEAVEGQDAQTLDLSILATGKGQVNFQARVAQGSDWLTLGSTDGSVTAGGPQKIVNVQASGRKLQAGEYSGRIEIGGDNGAKPASVTVLLRVVGAASSLDPSIAPASMAFVPDQGARGFVLRSPGKVSVTPSVGADPGNPTSGTAWLQVMAPGTFTDSALGSVSVDMSKMQVGTYRATVTLVLSGNAPVILQVLAVKPASGVGAAIGKAPAAGGCVPNKYLPVFTTAQPKFTQSFGAPLSTEIVIVDDCGNVVTDAAAGSNFSSRDRPLTLTPLGGGQWRATWVARVSDQGEVALETLTSDTSRQVQVGSVTVRAYMSGTASVPVLANQGAITGPNGEPQLALAPGSVFRINGRNLGDMATTQVLLGGDRLTLRSVSPTAIVAVAPDGFDGRGTVSLVVANGDKLSAPESVIVADNWPVTLNVARDANGLWTALLTGVSTAAEAGDLSSVHLLVDDKRCGVTAWKKEDQGLYRASLDSACRGEIGDAEIQAAAGSVRTGRRVVRNGKLIGVSADTER